MAAVPNRSLDDLCPSRRTVVRTLLAIGGAVLVPGVVTACSSGGDDASTDQAAGAGGSVSASEVSVGTAVVVDVNGDRVVVAQPTEGDFVAFSARCTHQGTAVEAGDGLVLTCPNHGSVFDAADGGAVLKGPATSALQPVAVSQQGDQLVLG